MRVTIRTQDPRLQVGRKLVPQHMPVDWREFSAAVIGHLLAWPFLLFMVVLVLRKPIAELLARLSTYEGLGQKVTFGVELGKLEEEVEVLVRAQAAKLFPGSSEPGIEQSPGSGIPSADPLRAYGGAGAVIHAWTLVEDALDQLIRLPYVSSSVLARFNDPNLVLAARPSELIAPLIGVDIIPKPLGPILNDLKRLRDNVAHGAHSPTDGEAITYFQTALDVVSVLNSLADSIDRHYQDPEE